MNKVRPINILRFLYERFSGLSTIFFYVSPLTSSLCVQLVEFVDLRFSPCHQLPVLILPHVVVVQPSHIGCALIFAIIRVFIVVICTKEKPPFSSSLPHISFFLRFEFSR